MGQELQIPDAFKGKAMAQAFAGLNAQDDNLSEGIGQSYGVIGYKGKVWSLRVRGERHNILDPASGTPSGFLDVIILGQAKTKSKSFYPAFKQGQSDGERPICASIDGLTPDADVQQKQCDSCALCPRNVWKTDPQTGRKGRECTDYKRLAVLVLPTQTKPIMGAPLLEPVFLRVPPDSLNSLAVMGETMGNQGFHYSSYICRITFDPQKAHPCMVFRPIQGLSDNEAPVILELRQDNLVGRIIGGDRGGQTLQPTQQVQPLLPAGTSATGLTASATSQSLPSKPSVAVAPTTPPPASISSGNGVAATATTVPGGSLPVPGGAPPATPTPSVSGEATTPAPASPLSLDTGLGGTTGPDQSTSGGASIASPGLAPSVATPMVADAGVPDASDADLDARIAALIKK